MKKYFENDKRFFYIFREGDNLYFVTGDLGGEGKASEQYALDEITERFILMTLKNTLAEEGYKEKELPDELPKFAPIVHKASGDFVNDALADKSKISILVNNAMPFGTKATKEWLEFVSQFLDKWGICEETLGLVARFSLFSGAKKHVAALCEKYDIPAILQSDKELNESMFYEIQSAMDDYYGEEDYSGYPTKGWVRKVVKLLSVPLIAFGYGIHPIGLKTMLRCFDNEAVEGISVDWYISDVAYDSEDFPYYDGVENEDDAFWENIDITELV